MTKLKKLKFRNKDVICETPGKCFAKRYENYRSTTAKCVILNSTYPAGMKCPFQKEYRN
jgi:hypothetical protein